jgi:hypothetical protein
MHVLFFEAEAEIAAKGYFADLVIEVEGRLIRPVFYDLHRFVQECQDQLAASDPCVREANLAIVERVDRRHLEAALASMSRRNFAGFIPDDSGDLGYDPSAA